MNYQKEKARKQYHLSSHQNKVFRIKEAKGLHSEHYKRLMKETEDNTNIWKNILCSLV